MAHNLRFDLRELPLGELLGSAPMNLGNLSIELGRCADALSDRARTTRERLEDRGDSVHSFCNRSKTCCSTHRSSAASRSPTSKRQRRTHQLHCQLELAAIVLTEQSKSHGRIANRSRSQNKERPCHCQRGPGAPGRDRRGHGRGDHDDDLQKIPECARYTQESRRFFCLFQCSAAHCLLAGGLILVTVDALSTTRDAVIAQLRLHLGGGHNLIGKGIRAGVTMLTRRGWFSPSLTFEAGHYFRGNANRLVQQVTENETIDITALQSVGYRYGNAHIGFEMGVRRLTFYFHAGGSFIMTTLRGLNDTIAEQMPADEGDPMIEIRDDPDVLAFTISARLGFILYF